MSSNSKNNSSGKKALIAFLAILVVLIGVSIAIVLLSSNADDSILSEEAINAEQIDGRSGEESATTNADGSALLTFVGDCTLSNIQGRDEFNAIYESEGPEYFFSGVRSIFEKDDLTVVNCEGPLTTSNDKADKGGPPVFWFKSPPKYVKIFSSSSVEAANIANNHIMDYGKKGYNDTIKTLEDAGIKHFGYYDDAIFDIKGIKVGLFGFAFDSDAGNIKEAIDKLKTQGAEYVVAVFHQGTEKVYEPNEQQVEAAHAAIDNGASLVIGHHPHVVQGVTEYKGVTIAYSLGNFCFGGNTNPDDKDSMIFQATVTRNADGFKTEHKIIPASISSSTNHNDYRPRVLKGSEGKRVLKKIEGFSKGL